MKRFETTMQIDAPAADVWRVLGDTESWPEWTPTMNRVSRLDDGPLERGSRARIRQPWMAPATWRVTRLVPGEGFDWETRGPGLRMLAGHWIHPGEGDGSTVTLFVEVSGPVGALLAALASGPIQGAVEREAAGLRERVEGAPARP